LRSSNFEKKISRSPRIFFLKKKNSSFRKKKFLRELFYSAARQRKKTFGESFIPPRRGATRYTRSIAAIFYSRCEKKKSRDSRTIRRYFSSCAAASAIPIQKRQDVRMGSSDSFIAAQMNTAQNPLAGAQHPRVVPRPEVVPLGRCLRQTTRSPDLAVERSETGRRGRDLGGPGMRCDSVLYYIGSTTRGNLKPDSLRASMHFFFVQA
jgi:hypothetical protein